ncbi:MAG: lamin tail domain-containing protein [Alphaproteobacteria bacterium]|nr:lamin tail domain-containing protein [Alphaproteobacteria bacterium]MCB9795951.1 lamin tail domain-containing protein [Alphaproteobacteria bacterium]
MTRHPLLALLLLAAACGEKEPTDDSSAVDDSAADDSATDDSAADDSATDDSAEAQLSELRLEASATALSTRETVTFTTTAVYDDGSEQDVSGEASLASGDEALLRFFTAGVGQPLDGGEVTVTAGYASLSAEATLTITVSPAQSGDLVFNELLIDGNVEGDPNGDGSNVAVEDEFIELANLAGVSVDLSGVTLSERDFAGLPRHTFADGTTLKAGEAIVVFGGGDVSALSADNVSFVVADNEDPGEPAGLSLTDSGDIVVLYSPEGSELLRLRYGNADISGNVPTASDASLQLSPDVEGSDYVLHSNLGEAYSPGTLSDGSGFPGVEGSYGG